MQQPSFSDALSNMTVGITDAMESALRVFDGGLAVYGGVVERVNAIKRMNQEIAQPAPIIVSPGAPVSLSSVGNFLKSESGLLVVGALSVLFVGLIFSHGE